MLDEFTSVLWSPAELSAGQICLGLLLSYILSQAVGTLHRWTQLKTSPSRSFSHALVLGATVTCVLTMVIGNNLARGMGMLGALALIRFRTDIRDQRDIIFLFVNLALGIATGAGAHLVAIVGTLFFCLLALYLHGWQPAGGTQYEGLVRFFLAAHADVEARVGTLFKRYCLAAQMVSVAEAAQGEALEYSYQVRLADLSCQAELLKGLRQIQDLSEPHVLMHRSAAEL